MEADKELSLFCETELTKFRKWNKWQREEMPTLFNCFSCGYVTAWIKYDRRKKIYKLCCTETYGRTPKNKDIYKTYYVLEKTSNYEYARNQFKKLCITMLTDEE